MTIDWNKQMSNPAGRLYILLQAAARNRNESFRNAWSKALGIEGSELNEFIRHYSEVLKLPSAIRWKTTDAGFDDDELLWFLPDIEKAISNMQLDTAWGSVSSPIKDEHMRALNGHSTLLAKLAGEPTIPEDKLREIRDQAQQLFDTVVDDETLDEDLKQFLLDALGEILDGIQNYWISGAAPVRSAVEQVIGSAVVEEVAFRKATNSRHWEAFQKILLTLSMTINIANGTQALTEWILPQLTASAAVAPMDVDVEEETTR